MSNELIRVYSHLVGLRSNPPLTATEDHAVAFNGYVDRLATLRGEDLAEFRIQEQDILRPPFPGRTGGEVHVDPQTYLARIDALMAYIRGTLPAQVVEQIGFHH